ncbi:Caulimovirus viroplasmin [Phytophthora infestans]|uniref:Caulimovirus viroplasmin n=1 Tax=Phytophthora infestans TaxID=4787 RepID=A0A833SQB0_PHYIN|nr:Caulimovirus viroplasmin [Phytophthora infestans]KAF4030389.1 Caulimovirus viroplasmin [Phytophthora infestans]KAF4131279.1 Caulimovirus viroplasmin [Phytophthora infestans]KAI9991955.1 hypothetical protein PInf_017335 [Phytophthora infestans]
MSDLVSFYAVTGGRCSRIFTSWERVLDATVGYPGAKVSKFSTLAEAEKFMRGQDAAASSCLSGTGWTGPAYAVAVGRRMGVFRTAQKALQQTRKYSGNSLKKFCSYKEAVEFLDHHHWRKMPCNDEDESEVDIMDELVAEETLDSIVDDAFGANDVTPAERQIENVQEATNLGLTSKRGRDDILDENNEAVRPTQRRKTDRSIQSNCKEKVLVCCFGRHTSDPQGNATVVSTCRFLTHPAWNVKKIVGPNVTTAQAELMAVLDVLKRVGQEDPDCLVSVIVFIRDLQVYDLLRECKSGDGNGALLKHITKEKGSRNIQVFHMGDAFHWE